MMRFMRYNSRHTLYFPRGYAGRVLPQLDPISSCSHGKDGKRCWSLHEPRWAFRLRQRLFAFAGRHYCQRRGESPLGQTVDESPDTWDVGPDGNRTCSYCGSIHFDDLMAICKRVIEDERYAIEGTTKSYKVYVRQPGVRNASEGAIKYYKTHTPENVTKKQEELFFLASRVSHERMMRRWEKSDAS